MYPFYFLLTWLATPVLPVMLRYRMARGKESGARLQERWGKSPVAKPEGNLLWIHAASMGECASILPFIERFLKRQPDWHIVVTSVTMTSAQMLAQKLPPRAIHQFSPLDHPRAIQNFLQHWQPNAALWVESELWPNMLKISKKGNTPLFLVNARMSERSLKRWKYSARFATQMLQCFTAIYPQSERDAARFTELGASKVEMLGNLKYDTPPLSVNKDALAELHTMIGHRPLWLAASTHAGEEEVIASAYDIIKKHFPEILTIIAPRHAARGGEIAQMLKGRAGGGAIRSASEIIMEGTGFYVADTMGELGLFYRLAPIAFIGGSLVPHGGQNILEAQRLGCAVITGEHTHNFAAIMTEMDAAKAVLRVKNAEELAEKTLYLLRNTEAREALKQNAEKVLAKHQGALEKLLERIEAAL